MANPAFFKVLAQSRHPHLHVDYDSARHRYVPSYLNPNGYDIDLDAFPGVEEKSIKVIIHKGGKTTETQQIRQRLKIPANAVSYDWKIERRSTLAAIGPGPSGFSQEKSNKIVPGRGVGEVSGAPYQQRFHVPSLGTYDITLRIRLASGAPLVNTVSIALHDFLVVSIGESAASGEGNPDEPGKLPDCEFDLNLLTVFEKCFDSLVNSFLKEAGKFAKLIDAKLAFDKDPIWLEENAHRSLRSGPARAAKALENPSRGTMVTFLSFARSGSEIQGGLLGPRTKDNKPNDPWIGNIGQIQEVKNTVGKRRIDALVISIGGNDIGFSDDLTDLIEGDLFGNDDANREKIRIRIDKNLAELEENFQILAKAVAGLSVSQVYLTEYPTAMFDKMKNGQPTLGGACGVFDSVSLDADLDIKDIKLIRGAAEKLNALLRKVAKDHEWFFIDGVAAGFAGHGYCADISDEPVSPFFWSLEQSLSIQGDVNGIMHPNTEGHGVYARQIAAAVRTNTITPALKLEGGVFAP